MPEEEYIPVGRTTAPNAIDLLDLINTFNSDTGKLFNTRFTNVNDLLSPVIEPTFEHIQDSPYTNAELGAILLGLTKQTLVNSREILFLKHLIALVTFDLLEQGIELTDKELQQNLQTYLKYR